MEGNKKKITAYISEYAAFIALVLLVLVLGCISPEFRTASNFLNLLRQATFNGLIAFGMTCVILSDGIDLSVGSTFALSAIICAEMLIAGIPASIAILAALAVGTALGNEMLGNILIAVCLTFFAFTTIISWNFFGKQNVQYMCGKKQKIGAMIYSILAIAFIFLGSLFPNDLVWELADMFNNIMVIPNVLALFALSAIVVGAVKTGKAKKAKKADKTDAE